MLIKEYLKKHPEITVVKEYCDDGFTGANFERPDFNRMMEAVRAGLVDCIVVKDLSRFGREYIEAGDYIQKIFPRLGIRFIAINDNFVNLLASMWVIWKMTLKRVFFVNKIKNAGFSL